MIGLILNGQNHLYVKMLFTGIPLFRSASDDPALFLQVRDFGSLQVVRTKCHPVRMLIGPQFHPSGRRAIPSRRPTDQASFVRTTWISIRTLIYIEKLLLQLASVRTSQQPVRTTSSDRSASDFLSKSKYGKIGSNVRTTWILVRTYSYIRQESQFKYNRPNVSQLDPNARSTDMEIAYSTSTVWMPAYHGPDAR
jgi:hypothetical protein